MNEFQARLRRPLGAQPDENQFALVHRKLRRPLRDPRFPNPIATISPATPSCVHPRNATGCPPSPTPGSAPSVTLKQVRLLRCVQQADYHLHQIPAHSGLSTHNGMTPKRIFDGSPTPSGRRSYTIADFLREKRHAGRGGVTAAGAPLLPSAPHLPPSSSPPPRKPPPPAALRAEAIRRQSLAPDHRDWRRQSAAPSPE